MDQYHHHRPPSSLRSSIPAGSYSHINYNHAVVTPPSSPPLPMYNTTYPLSPPSTRASVASPTPTNSNLKLVDSSSSHESRKPFTNSVISAAVLRAHDEHEMQTTLHNVQLSSQIWNPEIEPEHETTHLCDCAIHKYLKRKIDRLEVQELWSKAVMYPGEKHYDDCTHLRLFDNNPYSEVTSPYGFRGATLLGNEKPDPSNHAEFLHQTIALNTSLNAKARIAVQTQEPSFSIWELEHLESLVKASKPDDSETKSKRSKFREAFQVKNADEKAAERMKKKFSGGFELRESILTEENGRWQNDYDRQIVAEYQKTLGVASKVQELRTRQPRQYLHLLRAGYFEPIPMTWSEPAISNPLRFTIDPAVGWRGITPAWRGYVNIAEERLYWILSNRDSGGVVIKPDIVSALDMAKVRMASAVDIPPVYSYADDTTCHVQNTSHGYSKQVKSPFKPGTPISPEDETMVLLDVSGSMDFAPARPKYNQYLITGYAKTSQPKNKGNSHPNNKLAFQKKLTITLPRSRKVNCCSLHKSNGDIQSQPPRMPSRHILKSSNLCGTCESV